MYETFLNAFLEIYETNFPNQPVTVPPKDLNTLSMSKASKKYFIRNQNLHVKYLKQKITKSEKSYEDYQKLFKESLKKETKK